MNIRFSILLVIVLVLIGGSVLITRELNTREATEKVPWLFKLNMEDINFISVAQGDNRMDYVRTGDEWLVKDGNDSLVHKSRWAGTTLILSGPRSDRALADEIDDPEKYGLDPPQTRIEVVDISGFPVRVHLGQPTPDGLNWYARLVDSPQLFTVAAEWGEVVSKLAVKPPYLPFKVNLVDITGITVEHGDKEVRYAFKDGRWVIDEDDDIPVLEDSWRQAILPLNLPRAGLGPVSRIDDPAKYGLDIPQTTVAIVGNIGSSGSGAEFTLGNPTPGGERWYAKLSDSEQLFTVSAEYGEAVTKLATQPPSVEPPAEESAGETQPEEGG